MSSNTIEVLTNLLAGGAVGFSLIFLIGLIVLLVFLLIGRIVLFTKCGVSWWKAIIPFYSDYVMDVQICGLHWALYIVDEFLSFGMFTRLIDRLVWALRYYNLAKKCHRDPIPATIFGALFPTVVEMVYGFSSNCTYDANEPVGNCGFFNRVVK